MTQGYQLELGYPHVLPLHSTATYILAQLATSMFSFSLSTWTWDTFLTLRVVRASI